MEGECGVLGCCLGGVTGDVIDMLTQAWVRAGWRSRDRPFFAFALPTGESRCFKWSRGLLIVPVSGYRWLEISGPPIVNKQLHEVNGIASGSQPT